MKSKITKIILYLALLFVSNVNAQSHFEVVLHQNLINEIIGNVNWANFKIEVDKPFQGFDNENLLFSPTEKNSLSNSDYFEKGYLRTFKTFYSKNVILEFKDKAKIELLNTYFNTKLVKFNNGDPNLTLDKETENGLDKLMTDIRDESSESLYEIEQLVIKKKISAKDAEESNEKLNTIINWTNGVTNSSEKNLPNLIETKENVIKSLSDYIQFKFYIPYYKITTYKPPSLTINNNEINISAFLASSIRAELWYRRRHFKCSFHRLKLKCSWGDWKAPHRISHVSVNNLKTSAKVIGNTSVQFNNVLFEYKFDDFRIDYFLIRHIPLEQIVNHYTKSKRRINVYSASQLITTIPKLETKFGIKDITLPPVPNGLKIAINVRKLN